jgi:hypothetical protein
MGSGWRATRGTHLAATRGRATACGRAVICVDARVRWVSLNSLHSFFTTFALVVLDRVVLAGDVSSHPPRSPPPSRVTSSSVPRFREVPRTRRRCRHKRDGDEMREKKRIQGDACTPQRIASLKSRHVPLESTRRTSSKRVQASLSGPTTGRWVCFSHTFRKFCLYR